MPPLFNTLSRKLHAGDDDSASDPYSDELDVSSPSVLDGSGAEVDSSEGDEPELEGEENSDSERHDTKAPRLRTFGEVIKQDKSKKRKRGPDLVDQVDEKKLQGLREQLELLKKGKRLKTVANAPVPERQASNSSQDQSDFEESYDSESESDSSAAPTTTSTKRPSKHGPQATSSNKAVSRKRTVISNSKPASARARDPRFMRVAGPLPTNDRMKKDYAFLDDYRQSEIASLHDQLGITSRGKNKKLSGGKAKGIKLTGEQREQAKKDLVRMESQQAARRERERVEEVARRHRTAEREGAKQGKKPFFLKKSEQKRRALVDKFEGMKGRQRDKAIDRRRKKIAAKERKSMPFTRRRPAAD